MTGRGFAILSALLLVLPLAGGAAAAEYKRLTTDDGIVLDYAMAASPKRSARAKTSNSAA